MSKSLISGKALAIQLGREQTRIALVGANGDVLHSAVVPTPAGAVEDGTIRNQEAVRKMLKAATAAKEFKNTRKAVFVMATSQVITETVTVPELPEQKLEKLLLANADMYFPVDMKEYQLVWQTVGTKTRENGMTELMVQLWAIPLSLVTRYYTVGNASGLSVEAVDFIGNSVATAVGASFTAPVKGKAKAKQKFSLNMEISFKKKESAPAAPAQEDDGVVPPTELYISMDPDLLGMTFVQRGQVMMQRFVPCGSDPLAHLDELSMMVEYFRSMDMGRGSEITASAMGALADDRDLIFELSDILGLDVIRYASGKDPSWVLIAAAARTARDFGVPAMNKAAAARKQMGAELWQYVLVLAGGAVLVGVILLTLSSRLVWNAEIKGLENTQQSLSIQAAKVNGYADNYKKYNSSYDAYAADWDIVFGSLRTYNDNLVLMLEELEEVLPDKTSVLQLIINTDGITVSLASDSKEEAAYVIHSMRSLQYANFAGVTNLQGGGKGPVKTYGPRDEEEAAPTEGSNPEARQGENTIAGIISQELNQEELMALATTMTPEQFTLLEQAYGKTPATKYPTLEKLQQDPNVSASFTQRSDAISEMFSTNPFAVNHFITELEKDQRRSDSIIFLIVVEELLIMEEEGKLPAGGLDSAEGMQAYSDILIHILTKNETNLEAAEKLFTMDPYLESSYLHYLETEMSLREPETLPYLNLDAVLEDLMAGSFDTGDPELDKKLNSLISQEAWDMMEQMNSEEKMEALLTKYLTEGTTGNKAMDALINEYLTTGTTGSAQLDAIIKNKLGDQALDQQLGQMMQDYLEKGTTGNKAMDDMIAAYLTTGTTGNEQMDKVIANYLGAGKLDEQMMDMLEAYFKDGTTGNAVMDNLIKKYLTEGTTGNKKLDDMINGYIASGALETIVGDLVKKYLSEGTTGNTVLDGLISKYLNTGTTGNKALDKLIENYINGGKVDAELANLIQKFFNDGTTGNKALDSLIEKYLTTGSTGNTAVDKVILNYINAGYLNAQMLTLLKKYLSTGTTGNTVVDKLLNIYIKTGTTGNAQIDKIIKDYLSGINLGTGTGSGTGTGIGGGIGGGMGQAQDTRVFYTVALQYKQELLTAELARKGLDSSLMVEKVEVVLK